jgi:hypothetical protein
VSYNETSDHRAKEDLRPLFDPWGRVKQLNPVNFSWRNGGGRADGFIAHELQEVCPEAVTGEKDAVDDDGNPDLQGVDKGKIVPLLTAALQEAIAKIESLESRIAALESA